MTWYETVEMALQNLGGTASLKDVYGEVRKIRMQQRLSVPSSLEAIVRKELEYNSQDSSNWRGNRNLFFSVEGIGNGVWGLRAHIPRSAFASDLSNPDQSDATRISGLTTSRIIRDTAMTRKVKALHRSKCQICDSSILLPDGTSYAEAHHIIPIGSPHYGPDVSENIVIVCPNHHAQLDFGCVEINVEELTGAAGHTISSKSIAYHNEKIFVPKSTP
ncbi:HNH endonuclease [uncultured Cohaesibacter sp.]|uniref:HNH endonuclease n=1 Tax=uncultured Cohaesibacter sp. TaxID=1002546 RepID=UPI002AAB924E|nr:HNH endonuclease [uncultured Cohaesibacter sp.]